MLGPELSFKTSDPHAGSSFSFLFSLPALYVPFLKYLYGKLFTLQLILLQSHLSQSLISSWLWSTL